MIASEDFLTWRERDRFAPCHSSAAFVEDRLEIGRSTVLARIARSQNTCFLAFEGGEDRVLALLALAYLRPVSPFAIGKMRRAAQEWTNGDACLAQIHLAQAGLSTLDSPDEAAYRLSLADSVLTSGCTPRGMLKALDFDDVAIDKIFHPEELRVPKGNGQGSGEWTATPISARGYKVDHARPSDAAPVRRPHGGAVADPSSPTGTLMAPKRADYRQIYAAGLANSERFDVVKLMLMKQAVGHGGTYDFQRDPATMTFYPAYSNASNYAVGVYMAGLGFSEQATLMISETFAHLFSSNAGSSAQIGWIKRGWQDGFAGEWK